MLDLDFVRARFPALSEGWTLLDNAGGSVPLIGVIDAVQDYMSRRQVQLGASYGMSEAASEQIQAGHRAAAELVGAEEGEVSLGSSTTMNMKLLAESLRKQWQVGDEIIVTNLDHESNIGPWRRLEEYGIIVHEWRFRPETATLEMEDLDALLSERTRLVACTHCSNIAGAFLDVAAVARRVHAAGALICVDGVAYAPHRRVDVKALDVDFYAFSLYKTYGPHLGLLYGKRHLMEAAQTPNHFFNTSLPGKFEPGGVVHELTAALPAIPDHLEQLGSGETRAERIDDAFVQIAEHEEKLAAPLVDFLNGRDDVRIIGPATADQAVRAPTIAFVVDGRDAATIPEQVDKEKIAIRWGHFYAYRAIEALGLMELNGVVRVSMVHYNTVEEIHRLVETLDRVLSAPID